MWAIERRVRGRQCGAVLAAATGLLCAGAVAQPALDAPVQRVEIVGTTPLPGAGVAKDQVPSNVQTLSERRLRQSLSLPEAMATLLPSVNVNEVQGNPYQMDVNYRGFSASPLLGTAQGLSVFQDGVRVNEPFGDVVNWDLIPRAALASLTLLPGSNPAFGLNTLGGALTLQTKRGDTHPGTAAELQAGSFKRISAELTHGRKLGDTGHLFLAASSFAEDGWRDASPSRVRQVFAKTGQHSAAAEWALSLSHADNRLVGNGPVPDSMLAQRRAQVYTRPDITHNRMTLLTSSVGIDAGVAQRLVATAYARRANAATLNGDLNDEFDPPAVTAAGVENRSRTQQRGSGLALQWLRQWGAHQFTLGTSLDRAHSRFEQAQAGGALDANRAVVPEEAAQTTALVSGRNRTRSVYAYSVLALQTNLQLTLAGRYNDTQVDTVDEGRAQLGLPTQLDATGRYRKFNPAAGLTWQASPALTLYGNVGQGNRAPSPVELGCSDPAQPCVLPNALQSDPPLKQVVARTVEAGVRGTAAPGLRWNVTAFHTANRDDLLFVSNGRAAGYFTNVGRTRRQGVELGLSQTQGSFTWSASYSGLQATYQAAACIVAQGNSSAGSSAACQGEDEIEIRPGARLPGLPQRSLKLVADWQAAPGWNLGAQWRAYSSQFVRGNENNQHRPDGAVFKGSGRIGGYAVLDLSASHSFDGGLELLAKLGNVFDRQYASAGLLGRNAFDAAGALQAPAAWQQERFTGPGAPPALWVGMRQQFGG